MRQPVLVLAMLLLLFSAMPAQANGPDLAAEAQQRALAWLQSQQLPDGSFGVRSADGTTFSASASATADVVYLLGLYGEDPAGDRWSVDGHSALEALAALAPTYTATDAGQAGKVARAIALAGEDPRTWRGLDLLAVIDRAYDPASGRFDAQLAYRHSLALEGWWRAQEPVKPDAVDALLQAQLADGSWFWSFQGGEGDVDTTGRMLYTLSVVGDLPCAPGLLQAKHYLQAMQADTGGWEPGGPVGGPVNANSTAMAILGLRAAGYDVEGSEFVKNGQGPMQRLLAFQEPSGAFVFTNEAGRQESRLAATLDALQAMAEMPGGAQHCDLHYLPLPRLAAPGG